jgi:guanine nucleotide-binding protein G(I)/G(S)/G(T) subunit beta-1
MSHQERIQEARQQISELKSRIESLREEKQDTRLSDAVSDPVVAIRSISPRKRLKGHFGKVYALDWCSDNIHLISASQDGKLLIWNGLSQLKEHAITLRSAWVMTCAFEPTQNNLVACGGLDNNCSIYSLESSSSGFSSVTRTTKELIGHEGYLSCCRFLDEGNMLTSSGDSTCGFWDIPMGTLITRFTEHSGDVMSVSYSKNNTSLFCSGSCDGTVKVWDLRAGDESIHTFRGHDSDVNCVDFFDNGCTIATGSDDAFCKVFDIRSVGELTSFHDPKESPCVTSVSSSLSGRFLFSAYDDSSCYAWDLFGSEVEPVMNLAAPGADGKAHEGRVSDLKVSPMGDAIATGSWDTTLRVWA